MKHLLSGFLAIFLSAAACPAQISLPEKRQGALRKVAELQGGGDDASFAQRIEAMTNPFSPDAVAATAEGGDEGTSADFEALVQKSLRVSGIFQLADGSQSVFINSRRIRIGETFRFKVGSRDVEARLISIVQRRVTIDVDGRTVVLAAR